MQRDRTAGVRWGARSSAWVMAVIGFGICSGFTLFKREAPRPAADDLQTILQVQIFLDNQQFCAGKVDGVLGEFTDKAVAIYNGAFGDAPDNWYRVIRYSERQVRALLALYRIKESDLAFVNPSLPAEPEEQEGESYMAYRSLAEMVAERFHTDETFLAKLNPGKDLGALKVGDIVKVPNVQPFVIEDVPKMRSYPEDARLSARHVYIDTKERLARVFEGERIVASFPITPGKERYIPRGEWSITNMVSTPTFRWDKQMLEEGKRGDTAYLIPPGPNNPVGILWAGLSKSGIGLHGTSSPRTIGRSQSAGCVRFANWDAIRLTNLVRPGAKVTVY